MLLQGKKECFASCLFVCYDLIRADVALELAWMNNMIDFAFPYLLQVPSDLLSFPVCLCSLACAYCHLLLGRVITALVVPFPLVNVLIEPFKF